MKHPLLILATGLLLPAASMLAQTSVPTPLVEFDFNNGSLANSGSQGGSLTLGTPATVEQGKGVSGKPGDYAFNPRGAGTGTDGGNGRFDLSLHSTNSLTFTTWYQIDANGLDDNGKLLAAGRIVDSSAMVAFLGSDGGLNLTIAGSGVGNTSAVKYDITPGKWNFLAFTYTWDAQTNKGVLQLYSGGIDEEVTLLQTFADRPGPDLNKDFDWKGLYLGNNGNGNRAFLGLLDDVGFYGSTLSMEQLDAVRAQAAIPESSTYPILLGAFVACGAIFARRRLPGAKR